MMRSRSATDPGNGDKGSLEFWVTGLRSIGCASERGGEGMGGSFG
jgi:hypothetical protein